MMWILRWPVVLVLLVLVAGSLLPAVATTTALLNLPPIASYSPALAALDELGAQSSWLEAGLWYGAAVFFLIAAIRLIRRTQGFWLWLLGFACYGGRWAVTQQSEGGLVATVQSLSAESLQPENLTAESAPIQIGLLTFHLVIGLIILIIDAADRAYWDRNGR